MVVDKLSQCERYETLNPLFKDAFDFLKDAANRPNGRYELGNGMYASLSDTVTRPAGNPMEAHRKYIDIQYILKGHSLCGWAVTGDSVPETPYNEQIEAEFVSGPRAYVPVSEGVFYILFPSDAHEPHVTDGEAAECRVAVVKVPMNA